MSSYFHLLHPRQFALRTLLLYRATCGPLQQWSNAQRSLLRLYARLVVQFQLLRFRGYGIARRLRLLIWAIRCTLRH